MPRKRFVSTNSSNDKRLADLAERAGPWAVLLHTWAIPWAADDATLNGEPEELLSQIMPLMAMRGLVTVDDVRRFIDTSLDLGLLERTRDGDLRFPPKAFYQYQSYIGAERRTAQPEPTPPSTNGHSAEHRETARTTAEKKFAPDSPQNPAFVNSSSSSSLERNSGPVGSGVRGVGEGGTAAQAPPDLHPDSVNSTENGEEPRPPCVSMAIHTFVEARRHDFHDDDPTRTKRDLEHRMRRAGLGVNEFMDYLQRAALEAKDAMIRGKLRRNEDGLQKGWPLTLSKLDEALPRTGRPRMLRSPPGQPDAATDHPSAVPAGGGPDETETT